MRDIICENGAPAVAPTGPWATFAAAVLFALGLLMPLAFAVGQWKYRVHELDPSVLS